MRSPLRSSMNSGNRLYWSSATILTMTGGRNTRWDKAVVSIVREWGGAEDSSTRFFAYLCGLCAVGQCARADTEEAVQPSGSEAPRRTTDLADASGLWRHSCESGVECVLGRVPCGRCFFGMEGGRRFESGHNDVGRTTGGVRRGYACNDWTLDEETLLSCPMRTTWFVIAVTTA